MESPSRVVSITVRSLYTPLLTRLCSIAGSPSNTPCVATSEPNWPSSTLNCPVRARVSPFVPSWTHLPPLHEIVLPGMDARLVDIAANQAITLLEPKKRIDISDLQLPWRPIFAILEKELFPKQRKTGLTLVAFSLVRFGDLLILFSFGTPTATSLPPSSPSPNSPNVSSPHMKSLPCSPPSSPVSQPRSTQSSRPKPFAPISFPSPILNITFPPYSNCGKRSKVGFGMNSGWIWSRGWR